MYLDQQAGGGGVEEGETLSPLQAPDVAAATPAHTKSKPSDVILPPPSITVPPTVPIHPINQREQDDPDRGGGPRPTKPTRPTRPTHKYPEPERGVREPPLEEEMQDLDLDDDEDPFSLPGQPPRTVRRQLQYMVRQPYLEPCSLLVTSLLASVIKALMCMCVH
jgi:hypothetical protein